MATPDPTQLNFRVTNQDYTPPFDPDDRTGGSWLITFLTKPSEVKGQVEIPANLYSAENVAALIYPQAQEIERVHSLGQEGE